MVSPFHLRKMSAVALRGHYKRDTFSFAEKVRGQDSQDPPSCAPVSIGDNLLI